MAVVGGLSPSGPANHRVAAACSDLVTISCRVRPAVAEVPASRRMPRWIKCRGAIDLVDVFRKPDEVDALVDECIRLKLAIWLQDGVINRPPPNAPALPACSWSWIAVFTAITWLYVLI